MADATKVGTAAAGGERIELPALGAKTQTCGSDGYVCICYDVTVGEVERSVKEGFRSTELLKRYTTATMGACQGRLCHGQLRELSERFSPGGDPIVTAATTARPPARPLRLEEAVAGNRHHLERRTGLHDTHVALGARFLWAGQWKRVEHYGKPGEPDLTAIHREYRAVREGVGMIDVGTLGKFLVTGPGRRRVPREALPEPRRRSRAGAPALRPPARRGRRDPRRRHHLPRRRAHLLPHGHDVRRGRGRGADDGLARGLGPRRAHRQPDLGDRRDQRRRPEGARGARTRHRGRHLEGGVPLPPPPRRSPSPASPARRSASASSARSAGSCTTPPRAPRSCGAR